MMKISNVIVGVIMFGVLSVLIGYVTGFVMKRFNGSKIPQECADWNKNKIMEKSLFVNGMLLYLFSYAYTEFITRF